MNSRSFGVGAGVGPGGMNSAASGPRIHDVVGAPDDCISRVRWSQAGCPMQLLGVTSWDKTCRVWQVQAQGDAVQTAPMAMKQHSLPVLDISFSNDGRAFYGGCCKTAMEWNLQTDQTRQIAAHNLPISAVEYVCSNVAQEMVVTAGWDGLVRFWDLRQQSPVREEFLGAPVQAIDCRTSPLATFCTGRKLIVYDLRTMAKFCELEPHSMMKYGIRCVANLKNLTGFLVGSSEGRVAVTPLDAQKSSGISCCFKAHCVENSAAKNFYTMFPTNFVSTHPTANVGFSGGADGHVRVWSLSTKNRVFELPARTFNNESIPISAGELNADGSLLAYGVSYDWSMGKEAYNPQQPRAVCIMPVNPQWLK